MEFVLMRSWAFSGGVTVPVEGNCRVFAFGVLASQTPMSLTSQLSRGDLWCIMFRLLFKTMYANFWRCFVCFKLPMKKKSIVSRVSLFVCNMKYFFDNEDFLSTLQHLNC